MTSIIDDLLSLSRLEHGPGIELHGAINLLDTIESAILSCQSIAQQKNIDS